MQGGKPCRLAKVVEHSSKADITSTHHMGTRQNNTQAQESKGDG